MNPRRDTVVAPLARLLISLIFIISGLSKMSSWNQTVSVMAMLGIPIPHAALTISTVVEIGCGVAILFGVGARAASTLLVLYLIPVTLIMHAFWAGGANAPLQLFEFLKNLAIMGGLLELAVNGAGAYSFDARRENRRLEAMRRDRELRRVA